MSISLDQYSNFSYSWFLWYAKLRTFNISKLRSGPLSFTSCKAFLKNKRSGTSLPASFSARFFKEKYLSCYILLPDQISLSGCLREILRNMCNVTVC